MVTSYFRAEVKIWPYRACAMKYVQYNRYYRNSPVIVDLAIGQTPRSTERISSVILCYGCSLVLQYLVPGAIIVVCYWRVSVALRRRARTKKSLMTGGDSVRSAVTTSAASRRREQQEILRSRRTNRMLIAMVAIFIVCWLPLNVINLLLEYSQQFNNWRYILLVFFVAHVVAMSSTVYNPFLYAWMNDAFHREFQRVLPLCGAIGGTSSPTDETRLQPTTATAMATTTAVTRSVKAGDGGAASHRLTTVVENYDAGTNAAATDDVGEFNVEAQRQYDDQL